ncbi:MAG: hypothetical protein Q9O62_07290 [Ardenticatenia bacterium]|nr:hypothetical protein [Ardenticatenia bacterium]
MNLRWALDRLMHLVYSLETEDVSAVRRALVDEAQRIADEDVEINKRMGQHGAELVPANARILHHCNTGCPGHGGLGHGLGRHSHSP